MNTIISRINQPTNQPTLSYTPFSDNFASDRTKTISDMVSVLSDAKLGTLNSSYNLNGNCVVTIYGDSHIIIFSLFT
jgi:hypothetical protein